MTDSKRFFVAAKFLLLFSVLLLLVGCGGGADTKKASAESGREIKFTTVKSGDLGFSFIEGKTPNFYVFKTDAEWEEYWEGAKSRSIYDEGERQKDEPIDPDPYSIELEPIKPDVDFRSQIVVGIVYERPTSGFQVRINKVVETEDEIIVYAFLDGQDAGGYENTAPYQFVKINTDSDLPVRFDMEGANHDHTSDHGEEVTEEETHHPPSEEHDDGEDHHEEQTHDEEMEMEMDEPEDIDHDEDNDHH